MFSGGRLISPAPNESRRLQSSARTSQRTHKVRTKGLCQGSVTFWELSGTKVGAIVWAFSNRNDTSTAITSALETSLIFSASESASVLHQLIAKTEGALALRRFRDRPTRAPRRAAIAKNLVLARK